MTNKTPPRKIGEVENNETGRAFVDMLRKALNKNRYSVRVRGRGPNRRELGVGIAHDLRLKDSERMAIYIDDHFAAKIQRNQNRNTY
jgi:hypothetical protein